MKMESVPANLNPSDYPSLACAYAVFSISADEKEGRITESGTRYLEAAYFLHAHLLAIPYVESVYFFEHPYFNLQHPSSGVLVQLIKATRMRYEILNCLVEVN